MNEFPFVSDYQSQSASDDLKSRVAKTVNRQNRKSLCLRTCSGLVAALLVTTVTALNLSPTLARAASDVPALRSIVKIMTFNRYEFSDGNFTAVVTTPKIEGLSNTELEKQLNAQFKDQSDAIIAQYQKDVADFKKEFGSTEDAHMGIESGYTVKTNTPDYLALDIYLLNVAGSSSTTHSYYTIDKKLGKLLSLSDLFATNADYVTPISKYIQDEMVRQNKENGGMFWLPDDPEAAADAFRSIAKDQKFYVDKDGNLVICFDKYEVAAGAQGSSEFVIPEKVIDSIKAF